MAATSGKRGSEQGDLGAAASTLQAELELERAVLRRVVERVPAGICLVWGRELRIRLVNQRFYDLLPDRGNAIGRTLGEQFPTIAAEAVPFVERVFRERGVVELSSHPLDFADGEGERHYDATLMPIDEAPGVVGGVLITFRETTEEVRARRELEHELTEEHRIADTLQRSLMPEDLPEVAGLELAARYIAAGERHHVGGDFYEVFRAGDSLVVLLGDIAGKGPEAAALTARMRHTARALAMYERRPSAFLGRLHEALGLDAQQPVLCTAVCAVLDSAERPRSLRIASAGHPRALLQRLGDEPCEVGAVNPALGLTDAAYDEQVCSLEPGDRLLLYSDGLTDAGAPTRIVPVAELRAQLASRRGKPLGQVLDELVAHACRDVDEPRDDIAVLALERRPEQPQPTGG